MIKARGRKDGKMIEVVYNENEFTFNGKWSLSYEASIIVELNRFHPIGGTYYAQDPYEPLNIIEVLRNHFFDKPTLDIESDTDQMLDSEEGHIY